MKRLILASLFLCLTVALPANIFPQSNQNEAPLTNAAIVKLAKAGFKEKTIISIISARAANFDLSTDRMIELKRNGVSEKIIVAMLARQEGMDLSDESWSDDLLSDSGDKKSGVTAGTKPGNNGETQIFGSSGGQKSRTRSRGASGGINEDVQTTGTATVRILRPPTEAGGGASKLEKAPTLTNDSIIELVEAGFSEGTILRRIEQSSVDFDLSTTKLEELRKHRVSEKVLAAMKVAMGDDSTR